MKTINTLLVIVSTALAGYGQQDTIRIYNPDTDANDVISNAVNQAKA